MTIGPWGSPSFRPFQSSSLNDLRAIQRDWGVVTTDFYEVVTYEWIDDPRQERLFEPDEGMKRGA